MNPRLLQEPETAKAVAAHLDRELLDLSAALAAADEEAQRPDNRNEQTEAAHARLIDARFRIIDTPAQTLVGLAIKLRVVQVFVDSRLVLPKPGDDRSQHEMDEWAIANALWDAERLVGEGGIRKIRRPRRRRSPPNPAPGNLAKT